MNYNAEDDGVDYYPDKDMNELLRKKEELEREICAVNSQIAKKQFDVNSKLKKNVWYEYSGGLNLVYFKFTDADFVRDGELWLHTYVEEFIYRIGVWYHTGAFYRFPLTELELACSSLKEVSEETVKDTIKELDARVKVLLQEAEGHVNS